jgi:hypothetical protein
MVAGSYYVEVADCCFRREDGLYTRVLPVGSRPVTSDISSARGLFLSEQWSRTQSDDASLVNTSNPDPQLHE